jgi:hypothetical protein
MLSVCGSIAAAVTRLSEEQLSLQRKHLRLEQAESELQAQLASTRHEVELVQK